MSQANKNQLVTEVKVVKLIRTKQVIGDGTNENLIREVYQFWDFNGHLIFTFDPTLEGRDFPSV
jgi:hypothetical protein